MESNVESGMIEAMKVFAETEFVKRLRSRLIVRDIEGADVKFIRVGRDHDGGYVMVDDFKGVLNAYSGGISSDVSWDEAMAARGIDIFMYDHTINGLPKENERFHWWRTGLTGVRNPKYPDLETLPALIEKNGHVNDHNMILKLDIEGSEYSIFQHIDVETLERFRQIVIEFHGLMYTDLESTIEFSLDRLNATHQLVHIHANNFEKYIMRGGLVLPNVIEGTYVRRSNYKFVKSRRFFPTSLDQPNHPNKHDINLGYWGEI